MTEARLFEGCIFKTHDISCSECHLKAIDEQGKEICSLEQNAKGLKEFSDSYRKR